MAEQQSPQQSATTTAPVSPSKVFGSKLFSNGEALQDGAAVEIPDGDDVPDSNVWERLTKEQLADTDGFDFTSILGDVALNFTIDEHINALLNDQSAQNTEAHTLDEQQPSDDFSEFRSTPVAEESSVTSQATDKNGQNQASDSGSLAGHDKLVAQHNDPWSVDAFLAQNLPIDPQLYNLQNATAASYPAEIGWNTTQGQSWNQLNADARVYFQQHGGSPGTSNGNQVAFGNAMLPNPSIYPPVPQNGFGDVYCYPPGVVGPHTFQAPSYPQYGPQPSYPANLHHRGHYWQAPAPMSHFAPQPQGASPPMPGFTPSPRYPYSSGPTAHGPQHGSPIPAHIAQSTWRGPKSTGTSPSYFSGSEFEFCRDDSTEGLPDSQCWRFISGKKISSTRKDSTNVKLKQLSRCYSRPVVPPPSWGPTRPNGKPLFTYTKGARWVAGQRYSAKQLRYYVEHCPRQLFIWIQQCPSQSNWRLDEDDNLCRWDKCPARTRKIAPGWLRVAFDEFGMETSTGRKDPYKVAGTMHLWCFEQCFNLAELYNEKKLFADLRNLPLEELNRMSLAKDTDRDIMDEAFRPWFRARPVASKGLDWVPLKHEDTLSYALVKHHLNAQASARQSTRETRNSVRREDHRKTLDVHMGNLGLYSGIMERRCRDQKDITSETYSVGGNEENPSPHSADYGDIDTSTPTPHSAGVDLNNTLPDTRNLDDIFGSNWEADYNYLFVQRAAGLEAEAPLIPKRKDSLFSESDECEFVFEDKPDSSEGSNSSANPEQISQAGVELKRRATDETEEAEPAQKRVKA